MYLIVGLGNPGAKYATTRHNVGFMLIDRLSVEYSIKCTSKGYSSLYGKGLIRGESVFLVKPETFMNLSGNAVRSIRDYYKVDLEKILIICDDCELPEGKIRLRSRGGSGGQNGLKSIISSLGTDKFSRLRMGIGTSDGDLTNHVLGSFKKDEQEALSSMLDSGAEAVEAFITRGPQFAMNAFNSGS